MASSKVLASTTSVNSDLQLCPPPPPTRPSLVASDSSDDRDPTIINDNCNCNLAMSSSSMNVDGVLRNSYRDNLTVAIENTLVNTEITLIDAAGAISAISDCEGNNEELLIPRQSGCGSSGVRKTVDDVWREIVAGRSERLKCKVEAPDEMMTLEDFLARAGAVEEEDVKAPMSVSASTSDRLSGGMLVFDPIGQSAYDSQTMVEGLVMGFGNGVKETGGVRRGKNRGGPALELVDKVTQQRQRRMIKNRESAARSRERKQAYQVELESLAARLEEEKELLLEEKAERTKERFKQVLPQFDDLTPTLEQFKPGLICEQ